VVPPDEFYDGRRAAAALGQFCAEVGVIPIDVQAIEPTLRAVDSQLLQQRGAESF
jgi:hypothetical protein